MPDLQRTAERTVAAPGGSKFKLVGANVELTAHSTHG